MRFFTLLFLLGAPFAVASPRPSPYQDFKKACIHAFNLSTGTRDEGGKLICNCTANESKHQGVTLGELIHETARIRKDPKYKIANRKLLAAFHWCVISAMQRAEYPK